MSTAATQSGDLRSQIENLKSGIKEISHEINNPLGVLRMALHLMQAGQLDDEKRSHYERVINMSIDKIESSLKKLKELRENPSVPVTLDTPSENHS